MPRKKVGLALGSGAARGLAHIGVLEVLKSEGIPIDVVAGTSIGSVVGAIYAARGEVGEAGKWLSQQRLKNLASFVDLALPKSGFIKGNKIRKLISRFIGGDIDFKDLRIPFACVATDLESGEAVVFDSGPVTEAVRASISIPGVFTVVERGGKYLVDGALVNPVPVDLAQRLGADFVIAVNVIPELTDLDARKIHKRHLQAPGLIHILVTAIQIGNNSLVRASMENADVTIEPAVALIGYGDFHRAKECIRQGKLAARAAIPEIKQKLDL